MISEKLEVALDENFADKSFLKCPGESCVVEFASDCDELGKARVRVDGDQIIVEFEHYDSFCFNCRDGSYTAERRADEIVQEAIDFLSALFADQVVLWQSEIFHSLQISGSKRLYLGEKPPILRQWIKCYVWSGPFIVEARDQKCEGISLRFASAIRFASGNSAIGRKRHLSLYLVTGVALILLLFIWVPGTGDTDLPQRGLSLGTFTTFLKIGLTLVIVGLATLIGSKIAAPKRPPQSSIDERSSPSSGDPTPTLKRSPNQSQKTEYKLLRNFSWIAGSSGCLVIMFTVLVGIILLVLIAWALLDTFVNLPRGM